MPWVTGPKRRPYYTQARKVGGRVYFTYIGSGPEAERIAAEDLRRRQERERQRQVVRAERAEVNQIGRSLDGLHVAADALLHAALLEAGYHQHHRSEWRRYQAQESP